MRERIASSREIVSLASSRMNFLYITPPVIKMVKITSSRLSATRTTKALRGLYAPVKVSKI